MFVVGISLKKNQPLRVDHINIEYSNGDTTAGDAILYAENTSTNASKSIKNGSKIEPRRAPESQNRIKTNQVGMI